MRALIAAIRADIELLGERVNIGRTLQESIKWRASSM